MCVPELGSANPFLLLFNATTHFQCQPYCPLQVFRRDLAVDVWIHQLKQAADSFVHAIDVTPRKSTTPKNLSLK
jgi:hypothetical protein